LKATGDILILAGDIMELCEEQFALPMVDQWADQFEHTYLIPGNHEFYKGFDIKTTLSNFRYSLRPNVTYVNNAVINIADVDFIFTTLWSKVGNLTAEIKRCFHDFDHCMFDAKPLSLETYNVAHQICLEFLSKSLAATSDKKVVVTHHLPSPKCLSNDFKYHHLYELFLTDLTDLVSSSHAAYWLFGHSHSNAAPIKIGQTHLLSNTLGYENLDEFGRLQLDAFFEI
jgi:predicted phosphohydrolase